MIIHRLKLLPLVILMLRICISFANGHESLNRDRVKDELELRNKSLSMIEYIINKDIQGILQLLPSDGIIQYGDGDRYKTINDIEKGLLNKGYEYAYLFDTEKSKKYSTDFISIRDQLLALKRKNLRIKEIDFNKIEPTIAHIYFTWEGKREYEDKFSFCCFTFRLKKDEWKLVSLVFD